MNGKPMLCRAGPPTQKRDKSHSGKDRTSWSARAMTCSCGGVLACMAPWNSTAFLAELSNECSVCVATGALHLWTQLLLGRAVRYNRMQL